MAAKCTACGNTISTWQEVTTAASESIKAVWDAMKDKLDLAKLFADWMSGTVGITAGPLNVQKAPCPYCGKTGHWVDV